MTEKVRNENHWRHAAILLFVCLTVIVLVTFLDYGLTWDEEFQKSYGEHLLSWYFSGFRDTQALSFGNSYLYGGFFEILAQLAARISPLELYETRHFVTAAFGLLAIVCTYWIGANISNPAGGVFSALFLALTPVFYGHLFNNPKDIPFAALFTLALYFIIRSYDEIPRIRKELLVKTGIAIGLCMGVRIGGVFLAALMVLLWCWGAAQSARTEQGLRFLLPAVREITVRIGLTLIIAWVVMLLFWPWAIQSPILNPLTALKAAANFTWGGLDFFQGEQIAATDLPWSYLPTWLSISLPEFYFVSLIAGLIYAIRKVRTKGFNVIFGTRSSKALLLLLAFLFPILSAIVLGSTLYDGMRQFLFIIPPLAVVAGIGFERTIRTVRTRFLKYTVLGLTSIFILLTIIDEVRLHPYESVYFNRLIAGGLPRAGMQFETDYWGNSYKEGVEWVIKNYPPTGPDKIKVANCSTEFLTGYFIEQNKEASKRFVNVSPLERPDVFLATTRNKCNERPLGKVLHVVEREGVGLLYVFQSPPQPGDGR